MDPTAPLEGDGRKSLQLELKADGNGKVRAVFATFGVVDLDGDVVLRSAFVEGQKVLMAAAHDWTVPGWIGTGSISTTETEAIFEGEFFSEADGQSAYTKIKEAQERGVTIEWSWGFSIPAGAAKYDAETYGEPVRILGLKALKIGEVSPVVWGAGINTRTLAVKNANLRMTEHFDRVMDEVHGLTSRLDEVARLRAESRDVKEGRVLSPANEGLVEKAIEALHSLIEASRASRLSDDGKGAGLTRLLRDAELDLISRGYAAA